MKLVMTLLVRDEIDAIRANIEFHRAQGVDFFIATDNLSADGTTDVLREYEKQGLLHYILEEDDNYDQMKWVTRMARLAATDYGADWVINNDADEFWWPTAGKDLKAVFEGISDEYQAVVAQRYNFVALDEDIHPFWESMIFREVQSFNAKGKPLPPKMAHRAYPDVTVAQGNHTVYGDQFKKAHHDVIDIFHFPMRSYEQFTNKIVLGGQAYERNTTLDKNAGATWRKLYKEYQKNGLKKYYRKESLSPAEIEKGMRKGKLVRDVRLADYLRPLLPAQNLTG